MPVVGRAAHLRRVHVAHVDPAQSSSVTSVPKIDTHDPTPGNAQPIPAPTPVVPIATTTTGPIIKPVGIHAGLPDVMLQLASGMTVAHGSDPGDFYCEHAFFVATEAAKASGSSVLVDEQGEPMTSFLHNPSDQWTDQGAPAPQDERHADRRAVVGDAIKGYYEMAKPQIKDAPFRMLITGYGEWGDVRNNPTGDFVSHRENIDGAVQDAFGDNLLDGKLLSSKNDVDEYRYRLKDGGIVRVTAAKLPVADDAIDGGPRSIQHLIETQKPQAVLSMGVAGGAATFLAEFHCDDGGLAVRDGKYVHDDGKNPERNEPDNFSLGRALLLAGGN